MTRASIRLFCQLGSSLNAKKNPRNLEKSIQPHADSLRSMPKDPALIVRFVALLDQKLPQWRLIRDELNSAPLGHEAWEI